MVKIFVHCSHSQIQGLSSEIVIEELKNILSYYIPGYQYSEAYKRGNWNGQQRLISKSLIFQTGLLKTVQQILNKYSIEHTIIDERPIIKFGKELSITNVYPPRQYQLQATEAMLKNKVGLVRAATGSGKTLIMAMFIAKTNIPTMVYVIGKDLLYQTQKEFNKILGFDCGIIGDGNCDIKNVTIATVQTASAVFGVKRGLYVEEIEHTKEKAVSKIHNASIIHAIQNAKAFIFDEAQFLGADSLQILAKNSNNAVYRFGLSGTPWRDGGDDILLEAATGHQICSITASELIDMDVLVQPKIFFMRVPENLYLNLRKKPKKYIDIYQNYIVLNEKRNEMIIKSVDKLHSMGKKILILIKKREHGDILLSKMPKHIRAIYLNGDDSVEDRTDIKEKIKNNEVDVIIATTIFDQGFDLPELDALVLAGGGKSSTKALQRIGRVIRGCSTTNKKEAIVIDFYDNSKYLEDHSKRRCEIYKTEPKFLIQYRG